jgi:hypothetical protein
MNDKTKTFNLPEPNISKINQNKKKTVLEKKKKSKIEFLDEVMDKDFLEDYFTVIKLKIK